MKNDIPVEEVIELKDELEMEDIMKLQDGITKEDAIAIINEEMSVEEVIEMKEENEVIRLGVSPIESTKFPNFAKEEAKIIDIDNNDDGGVSFLEVMSNQDLVKNQDDDDDLFEVNRDIMREKHREILESVRNTRPNEVN